MDGDNGILSGGADGSPGPRLEGPHRGVAPITDMTLILSLCAPGWMGH